MNLKGVKINVPVTIDVGELDLNLTEVLELNKQSRADHREDRTHDLNLELKRQVMHEEVRNSDRLESALNAFKQQFGDKVVDAVVKAAKDKILGRTAKDGDEK